MNRREVIIGMVASAAAVAAGPALAEGTQLTALAANL